MYTSNISVWFLKDINNVIFIVTNTPRNLFPRTLNSLILLLFYTSVCRDHEDTFILIFSGETGRMIISLKPYPIFREIRGTTGRRENLNSNERLGLVTGDEVFYVPGWFQCRSTWARELGLLTWLQLELTLTYVDCYFFRYVWLLFSTLNVECTRTPRVSGIKRDSVTHLVDISTLVRE